MYQITKNVVSPNICSYQKETVFKSCARAKQVPEAIIKKKLPKKITKVILQK
jgi:hypothetical protein